jgi:hypothetical protein
MQIVVQAADPPVCAARVPRLAPNRAPGRPPQRKLLLEAIGKMSGRFSRDNVTRDIDARDIAGFTRAIETQRIISCRARLQQKMTAIAAKKECCRAAAAIPETPIFPAQNAISIVDANGRRSGPRHRSIAAAILKITRRRDSNAAESRSRICGNGTNRGSRSEGFGDSFGPVLESGETLNRPRIRQPQICRLRLAPTSGISALTELWPSG